MNEGNLSVLPDQQHKLVRLRSCSNAAEAAILQNRLESAGITAFVTGAETTTMLSYVGPATGTVRVEVPLDSVEKAEQVLARDELDSVSRVDWNCSRCDQPNEATFDLCWNCNKSRDDQDGPASWQEPTAQDAQGDLTTDQEPATQPTGFDENPYQPPSPVDRRSGASDSLLSGRHPESEFDANQREANHDSLVGAFRASVVGMFLLPPLLNLYSLYRVLMIVQTESLDERDQRLYWVTLGVNLFGLMWGAFWILTLFSQ